MSLIFDVLKKHEGHDITCMQKEEDYVAICKTCKKNILVFGEPKHEKCFERKEDNGDNGDWEGCYTEPICKCPYPNVTDCLECPEGIGI